MPPLPNPASPKAQASDRLRLQLQHLARRLHALGPRPLFHFLDEIERGAPIRQHLERYARLPTDFIKVNRGDRFAAPLLKIEGGGR